MIKSWSVLINNPGQSIKGGNAREGLFRTVDDLRIVENTKGLIQNKDYSIYTTRTDNVLRLNTDNSKYQIDNAVSFVIY